LCEFTAQKLARAKRQELESEEHMSVMGLQEKDRLIRDIKRLNKELDETRDRCSMYEVLTHSRDVLMRVCLVHVGLVLVL